MPDKFRIVFSPAALIDVKESRNWYNLQQKGLGKRFVGDIRETIELIKKDPFFASVKYATIRTTACKTFPFSIHYEIDEINKIVRILSVFHFSRKPFWLNDPE
jgi:plasmid stabilization system protein ParE